MLGAGGGFGSMVAVRYAGTIPAEQQSVIRGLTPILARVSLVGLVLLWITGVWMGIEMGGMSDMPWTFWAKMTFVATLTLAAIGTEITYGQVKRGNAKAAARLPILGPIAGISSLLAVGFAVFTFH
jgi:hypothetical protein